MNKEWERTLDDRDRFKTYTLAIRTLFACTQILVERGADMKGISFIQQGMLILTDQIKRTNERKKAVSDVLKKKEDK